MYFSVIILLVLIVLWTLQYIEQCCEYELLMNHLVYRIEKYYPLSSSYSVCMLFKCSILLC